VTDLARRPETGTGELRLDLARRLVAEALGTALLVIAVVGSGIMASQLSPDDVGLELLENAVATAGALVGLILMFGAVSGAHFNPVVTLVDHAFGTISRRDSVCYIAAQVVGGCCGTIIANLMFELPAVEWSTKSRSSGALWLSEVVATVGLLLVIHGCVRRGGPARSPSLWGRGSAAPTGSPRRRASPTPPSRSPARSPTASPASSRHRRPCSSSCNWPAVSWPMG
jgi:arsenate reductase